MDGYQKDSFTAATTTGREIAHDIYTKGAGPVIVIIQELPGIGPETLHLADKFEAAGFTVVLPHLFGPLGKISLGGNVLRVFCMRREFHLFAKRKTSPIVDWLRALCQKLKTDHGVPGVATIGMCLTGNFAISLMADDAVLAGVASQPSMPLHDQNALHMSDAEISDISDKLDRVGPMKAYRIAGDKICRAEKFAAIDRAFNQGKERIELNTLPGKGHSVLTLDFVDEDGHPTKEAFDNIVGYFRKQLSA
ncbi:MAG: dienelactone hydrolase family protein [Pseudomonadota bacterium]